MSTKVKKPGTTAQTKISTTAKKTTSKKLVSSAKADSKKTVAVKEKSEKAKLSLPRKEKTLRAKEEKAKTSQAKLQPSKEKGIVKSIKSKEKEGAVEKKIVNEVVEPVKHIRVQTAEGWKRSMLKA